MPPGTKYVGKAKAGTQTLFIKAPGGNDKVVVEKLDADVLKWTEDWEI